MGGPSGVCNTCVRIEDLCEIWLLVLDELLQLCNLANLLERKHFILLVTIHCKTCGVVSSIFESGEAVDKCVNYVAAVFLNQIVDVPKDSASNGGQLPTPGARGFLITYHILALCLLLFWCGGRCNCEGKTSAGEEGYART
jgi:hypothetical protein